MNNYHDFFYSLGKTGSFIGKGIIAGFAGTVAITLSQMIEMQFTKREMSDAPVTVGGKVLGVEPRGQAKLEKERALTGQDGDEERVEKVESNKGKFSQIMHFGYGTSWGIPRAFIDMAGIKWPYSDAVHFGAVWGAALVMLPSATDTPPVFKWPAKQVLLGIVHHAVYACAAGLVYEALKRAEIEENQTELQRFLNKVKPVTSGKFFSKNGFMHKQTNPVKKILALVKS